MEQFPAPNRAITRIYFPCVLIYPVVVEAVDRKHVCPDRFVVAGIIECGHTTLRILSIEESYGNAGDRRIDHKVLSGA